MEKELSKFMIENSIGGSVVFLRAFIDNKFVPQLSYHLHFIYSYDNSNVNKHFPEIEFNKEFISRIFTCN